MGRHLKLFPSIHGQGEGQPRVSVIIMNGIPDGKWRAIAAQRAQKALDAGRHDGR